MASMAILNAKKAERHRMAEADNAAYEKKEAELEKKRREETKNAREMAQERAKNHERKLKAQGGREWDSEKVESDIVDRSKGRSSDYVRGGHGGVMRGDWSGRGFSRQEEEEDGGTERRGGRGRGVGYDGRGRGAGNRGRGRGGAKGPAAAPTLQSAEDFPSLPKVDTAVQATPGPNDQARTTEPLKSPGPVGEWAEEMAVPVNT